MASKKPSKSPITSGAVQEPPRRTDLPRWNQQEGTIAFNDTTLVIPVGDRMLLGETEHVVIPLLPFQAVTLRALLEQILQDPAIYLRLGTEFRIETILERLQKMALPDDQLQVEHRPITALDESFG